MHENTKILISISSVILLFYILTIFGFGFTAILTSSMEHANETAFRIYWTNNNVTNVKSLPFNKGINVGDVLIYRKTKNIQIGDPVFFYDPSSCNSSVVDQCKSRSMVFFHRMVNRDENFIYLRGDNIYDNLEAKVYSDQIEEELVIGVPVLRIPKVGLFKVKLTQLLRKQG